ncbi:MAG TPA: hypothetical protein VFY51_12180 [Pyrinomonadaceae bacterium]|nr:hypothetical protein [Pyrinomonadaceae bacterium]
MMFLTIGATVALLALPVAAQTTQPAAAPANTAQDGCAQETRDALYKTFTDSRTADQKKAYDSAKKYLACPVATPTESQTKIIEYLTRWVGLYEKGERKNRFTDELYNKKNYVEAFKIGGEILKDEPDNTKVMVDLGANGYLVGPLNNASLTAEAVEYARRALAAVEGGKTVDDWTPLQNKDVAVAYLNYTIGSLTVEKDPSGALKYLLKSAQFETPLKKSAFTYALIAGAYETGPYAKQAEAYKIYKDKEETPESKLALANIHQLVDRMIDGYARAVALAGSDAKLATQKTAWKESLKTWYKFRNPNDPETAMDTLVAGILTKPLPPEPTPLTSLPPTPTTTSGTPAPGTSTGTTGAGNGATTPAKPASTPTPTPASANSKPEPPKKPRQ